MLSDFVARTYALSPFPTLLPNIPHQRVAVLCAGVVDIVVGATSGNLIVFLLLGADFSVVDSIHLPPVRSTVGLSTNIAYVSYNSIHLLAYEAVDVESSEKVIAVQNFTIDTRGSSTLRRVVKMVGARSWWWRR